jgi:AcrR family transcriptional regulator
MSARETILDAAAQVMREKGLARATTKEIARTAGYSEALLYKHFADKQEIYLAVLQERAGGLTDARELIGTAAVRENLVGLVVRLMAFYVQSFPMSASIFSDRELLANWRASMEAKGGGPQWPIRALRAYLDGELSGGRIRPGTDAASIAALLCGAAFQAAFLACFEGLDEVPRSRALAAGLVDTALGDAALV